MKSVTATISSAADTFTTGINPRFDNPSCKLNLSIDSDSVWSGTIRLQRKLPTATKWQDVATYAGDTQEFVEDHTPGILYRIGSYAADYTAGAAVVILRKQS